MKGGKREHSREGGECEGGREVRDSTRAWEVSVRGERGGGEGAQEVSVRGGGEGGKRQHLEVSVWV